MKILQSGDLPEIRWLCWSDKGRWYKENWVRMQYVHLVVEEMVNQTVWRPRARGSRSWIKWNSSQIPLWEFDLHLNMLCSFIGPLEWFLIKVTFKNLTLRLREQTGDPCCLQIIQHPPREFRESVTQVSDVFHQGLGFFHAIERSSLTCVRSFFFHLALNMTFELVTVLGSVDSPYPG